VFEDVKMPVSPKLEVAETTPDTVSALDIETPPDIVIDASEVLESVRFPVDVIFPTTLSKPPIKALLDIAAPPANWNDPVVSEDASVVPVMTIDEFVKEPATLKEPPTYTDFTTARPPANVKAPPDVTEVASVVLLIATPPVTSNEPVKGEVVGVDADKDIWPLGDMESAAKLDEPVFRYILPVDDEERIASPTPLFIPCRVRNEPRVYDRLPPPVNDMLLVSEEELVSAKIDAFVLENLRLSLKVTAFAIDKPPAIDNEESLVDITCREFVDKMPGIVVIPVSGIILSRRIFVIVFRLSLM
jgi:hypothetical protein